jgi:hypothetical protein
MGTSPLGIIRRAGAAVFARSIGVLMARAMTELSVMILLMIILVDTKST